MLSQARPNAVRFQNDASRRQENEVYFNTLNHKIGENAE
jgi:hypothetical protein